MGHVAKVNDYYVYVRPKAMSQAVSNSSCELTDYMNGNITGTEYTERMRAMLMTKTGIIRRHLQGFTPVASGRAVVVPKWHRDHRVIYLPRKWFSNLEYGIIPCLKQTE